MITFPNIGYIGRLGNQMFQYAALISASKISNDECSLLSSNLELYKCFNIPTRISSYFNYKTISPNNFNCDNGSIFGIQADLNQYEQLFSTKTDQEFLKKDFKNKSITGFFQSYKYFQNVEDQLRIHFQFKKKYLDVCNLYIDSLYKNEQILSLHVRRTDYLKSSVLNNLNLKYYEDALSHFDKSLIVLVFSDDPEWCIEQTIFKEDRFKIIRTDNTYVDFCLMSKCDYHIIANSSFSWWGSWLAKSKKTICPKKWFLSDYNFLDSDELRLPNWISI